MTEKSGESRGPVGDGIVAREAQEARSAIATALTEIGLAPPARGIDLRPVPFAGTWGVASSVCHAIAGDLVVTELEASGALDGLSKKEAVAWDHPSVDLGQGKCTINPPCQYLLHTG